ncbi:hypothetical protein, partial [Acidianus sp.]|uniref:hypothetical protein n=1 Tax=Acidianus sp. TaxID=1872104 RepID=UPI00397B2324
MSQEELEEYEAEGNVEETEEVLKEQNEAQGYGICLDILNSLASIATVLASRLGAFTSLITDMKEVNEELKCNEKIPKRIEENSNDLNYLKMTLPAVATNEEVRCGAENYPLYTLFRQGIMVRTNCNGNNMMVYIGGASSFWRAGKRSHVSVYQFGAERRFPYNASMYQRMSELMKSRGVTGGYIVVLFGAERSEQGYVRDSQGHCKCDICPPTSQVASRYIPSFLLGLGNFFVVSQPPQFLQPRMYLVVGDDVDEYYVGSPIYSTGEECGDARISGSVLQAFSLDEYCKLYAQATG